MSEKLALAQSLYTLFHDKSAISTWLSNADDPVTFLKAWLCDSKLTKFVYKCLKAKVATDDSATSAEQIIESPLSTSRKEL
jgi:hypothetical protein